MKLRSITSLSELVSSSGKKSQSFGARSTVFTRLSQLIRPVSCMRPRIARTVVRLMPSRSPSSGSDGRLSWVFSPAKHRL